MFGYCARCGAYTRSVFASSSGGSLEGRSGRGGGASDGEVEALAAAPTAAATHIAGEITFALHGYAGAEGVSLAGSFNGWDPHALHMAKDNYAWVCKLELAPGTYEYKFVVDGRWVTDPANSSSREDGAGNINSVLVVKAS